MQDTTVTDAAAEHIRRLRQDRGWSAQRLADECRLAGFPALTRGTIAKIESGARKHLNADELAVLAHVLGIDVDELLGSRVAAERFVREQFVNLVEESGLAGELSEQLHTGIPGLPPELASPSSSRAALVEIVERCSRMTGGLSALARTLEFLRPGSDEAARLRELAEQVTPRAGDTDALRGIVEGVVVPDLAALVREASDGPVEWSGEGVIDAYLELLELSGDERTLVPLIFLELVADRSPAVRDELREWINRRADHLNVRSELTRFRHARFPSAFAFGMLTLMICIEPADDEGEYLLTSWRQRDPREWPPPRGPILRVTRTNLEAAVDEIVIEAETAWVDHRGDIQLEFLLPRALLDLPVDEWRTELASGAPVPLALRYPVTVRSLERMRSRHWHRAWYRRALHLPHSTPADNLYQPPAENADPLRDSAVLSDDRWTAVALNAPPVARPAAASDELTPAFRAGVPVVVWRRDADTAETAAQAVRDLLGDAPLSELPQRIAAARRAAFRDPANDPAARLVVLWDDPARLVPAAELDLTGTETES